MKWAAKWLALLFLGGMGLPLFVGGCVLGLQGYALYRDGVTVQGHVVENRWRRMGDRQHERIEYFPVVEFTAAGEKRHRFVGDEPRDAKVEIGSTMNVLYDPKDPSTATIVDREDFELLWQRPLVMGVWGVLLLAVGIGVFFMIRSDEKTKRHSFGPGIPESNGPSQTSQRGQGRTRAASIIKKIRENQESRARIRAEETPTQRPALRWALLSWLLAVFNILPGRARRVIEMVRIGPRNRVYEETVGLVSAERRR